MRDYCGMTVFIPCDPARHQMDEYFWYTDLLRRLDRDEAVILSTALLPLGLLRQDYEAISLSMLHVCEAVILSPDWEHYEMERHLKSAAEREGLAIYIE